MNATEDGDEPVGEAPELPPPDASDAELIGWARVTTAAGRNADAFQAECDRIENADKAIAELRKEHQPCACGHLECDLCSCGAVSPCSTTQTLDKYGL